MSSITFSGKPRSSRQLRRAARRLDGWTRPSSMDDPPPTGTSATTWMGREGAECPLLVPSKTETSIGWASRVSLVQSRLVLAEPSSDRRESSWRGGNNIPREPSSSATERLFSRLPVAETGWQKSVTERSRSSRKDPLLLPKLSELLWTIVGPVSSPPTTEASEILRRPEYLLRRAQIRHKETSYGTRTISKFPMRYCKGSPIYNPPFCSRSWQLRCYPSLIRLWCRGPLL